MKKKSSLSESEHRPFEVISRRSEFGRSNVVIRCPFCGSYSRAYIWSLAGNGKRCENRSCCALFVYGTCEAYRDIIPAKVCGAGFATTQTRRTQ